MTETNAATERDSKGSSEDPASLISSHEASQNQNVSEPKDVITQKKQEEAPTDSGPAPAFPVSGGTLSSEILTSLKVRLNKARKEHDQWIDAIAFNGGTIFVLLLTAAATFIPSLTWADKWWAPLCSGIAGFWIAAERALGFGARWRYHRDMKSGYDRIIDMLDFYPGVPMSEQPKYARDIFSALYALRSRESAIPNAGT